MSEKTDNPFLTPKYVPLDEPKEQPPSEFGLFVGKVIKAAVVAALITVFVILATFIVMC